MKLGTTKRLIIGSALALVFVGGAFVNANAQFRPQCQGNCATVRPPVQATCQGSYSFGPSTPVPFGTVGGAGGG